MSGITQNANGTLTFTLPFVYAPSEQPTCDLCAEYQRGERSDQSFSGLRVHLCENMVGYDNCPCGCELRLSELPEARR